MKRCPFCAEDIQDAAVVCKHCKRAVVPTGLDADLGALFMPQPWRRAVGAILGLVGLIGSFSAAFDPPLLVPAAATALWVAIIVSLRARPFVRYAGGLVIALAFVAIIASVAGAK